MRKLLGVVIGGLAGMAAVTQAAAITPPSDTLQFGPDFGTVQVGDLAHAADGSWYVVGRTRAAFAGETLQGELDPFVAKVSREGEVLWVDQFSADGMATAVVLDGSGGAYVAGMTEAGVHAPVDGYSDSFVRRYAADGTVLWSAQFSAVSGADPAGGGTYEYLSDAELIDGTLYLVGVADGGFIRSYDANGTVRSHERTSTEVEGISAYGDDIYLVGAGSAGAFVRRHGERGVVGLSEAYSSPLSVVANATGVYVAVQVFGEQPMALVSRFDHALNRIWEAQVDAAWSPSLGVDALGNAYLAYTVDGDVGLTKLGAGSGTEVWTVELGTPWSDEGQALVVEGDTTFVAGSAAGPLREGATGGGFIAGLPTVRAVPVHRLGGTDRIGTAIAVSQRAFATTDTVVVASADDFADAVVAGALAAHGGGPLLLTSTGSLDLRVAAELLRVLEPGGEVLIVGGRAAVSDAVRDAIAAHGASLGHRVQRIAGAHRFATAVAVAERIGSRDVVVADGRTFADALTAGTAAANLGRALVLTDGSQLPAATRDYLLRVRGDHLAIGGPAARAAPGARPIVGVDRYATSAEVARQLFSGADTVGLASGLTFPDGLAAAPLLAQLGAPLLLSAHDQLPVEISPFLELGLDEVLLFGGLRSISPALESAIRAGVTESEQP